MTSSEQAEHRMANAIRALYYRQLEQRKLADLPDLAARLNQPVQTVFQAISARRMSAATASMLAVAMGCRLVATRDRRSMEPVTR